MRLPAGLFLMIAATLAAGCGAARPMPSASSSAPAAAPASSVSGAPPASYSGSSPVGQMSRDPHSSGALSRPPVPPSQS